jgi:hypothetical protein
MKFVLDNNFEVKLSVSSEFSLGLQKIQKLEQSLENLSIEEKSEMRLKLITED